jgi:hypothetical protein
MGTSQAVRLPKTQRMRKIPASLRNPELNASTVVDAVASAAIPALSGGLVSEPVVHAAIEGVRFALEVKEHGLNQAVERTAIRLSEKYVVPSIAKGLWDVASSQMDPQVASSPYGRLAEVAFKKTVSTVASKGIKAMVEGSHD